MRKVPSKDGTPIAYWRSGSGPPLVLVHGTTADHRRWETVSPYLEAHFTLYAMDRRGRGESGDAPDYDMKREAEDIAAVVEDIGEPTFVLGHSFGAVCSLEATLLTDKVRRLVLYEPPFPTGGLIYPPGAPERIQALADQGELEAGLEVMMREVARIPEKELIPYRKLPMWKERIKMVPTIAREITFDRSYEFEPARFADLKVPTMLLLGGDSPEIYRKATKMVDEALSDSRIIVISGQTHVAMDLVPELFAREVRRFLLE